MYCAYFDRLSMCLLELGKQRMLTEEGAREASIQRDLGEGDCGTEGSPSRYSRSLPVSHLA